MSKEIEPLKSEQSKNSSQPDQFSAQINNELFAQLQQSKKLEPEQIIDRHARHHMLELSAQKNVLLKDNQAVDIPEKYSPPAVYIKEDKDGNCVQLEFPAGDSPKK